MPDDSKRLDDREKIQGQHQTELVDHANRLRDLEAETKDLVEFIDFLWKHPLRGTTVNEEKIFLRIQKLIQKHKIEPLDRR
jgi:hypothetical protein